MEENADNSMSPEPEGPGADSDQSSQNIPDSAEVAEESTPGAGEPFAEEPRAEAADESVADEIPVSGATTGATLEEIESDLAEEVAGESELVEGPERADAATAAEPETENAQAPAGETAREDSDESPDGDEASAIPRVDTAVASGIDDTPTGPVTTARIPWWPFLVYVVAWIAVIGTAFYVISYEPEALPAFQQDDYPYILLAGLVLTVLGPLLAFLVWAVTWFRTPKGDRGGLLTAALLKGALVTCFGVLAWWGTIAVLDALRLGLIGTIS